MKTKQKVSDQMKSKYTKYTSRNHNNNKTGTDVSTMMWKLVINSDRTEKFARVERQIPKQIGVTDWGKNSWCVNFFLGILPCERKKPVLLN
jgi:hypothetical protein